MQCAAGVIPWQAGIDPKSATSLETEQLTSVLLVPVESLYPWLQLYTAEEYKFAEESETATWVPFTTPLVIAAGSLHKAAKHKDCPNTCH